MFEHGGDWAGFREARGELPLDFSASVSPLGLPAGVREAVAEAMDLADRYPDPFCRALRRDVAAAWGVPAERILCGNGAGDLIERLVRALPPGRAVVPAPSFSEYAAALRRAGWAVDEWRLAPEEGFPLTESFLSAVTEETGLVFLCEPNNPTGVTAPRDLLLALLDRCRDTGTVLAVDECFNGLLPDPEAHTLLPFLDRGPLLVLNAFTKLYALAGLRLGFVCCADPVLLERMRRCGQPWPVSVPAQAAGRAALRDRDYPRRLRALLDRARPELAAGLAGLGADRITGEANFLLFRHPLLRLAEELEAAGILIRRCETFSGLGPGWYRTAVRTPEENGELLEAMRRVIR